MREGFVFYPQHSLPRGAIMGFLIALLIGGLALLAGGQVWALTGSLHWAILVGLGVFSLLGWGYWRFLRVRQGVHIVAEVHSSIRESDFTELVAEQNEVRTRVQKLTSQQAARTAHTVRSMLRKQEEREGRDA